MKRFLFFFSSAILASCGGSSSDVEPTFTLKAEEIKLAQCGESRISVKGASLSDCKITIDDDYVAEATKSSKGITVTGKHVGETALSVDYLSQTKICKVSVTPLYDCVGHPILDFDGVSKSFVRNNVDFIISRETIYSLEGQEDEEGKYYSCYLFNDNNLVLVKTYISDTEYKDIYNCLVERYNITSYENDDAWFEYPSKFVIHLSKVSEERYKIVYAKDKDIMNKYGWY